MGAHPPTAFPSGAIPCADGFVAPGSIRAVDWEMQCLFYERPDLIEDPEYTSRQRRVAHIDDLWEIITPWYDARTKREIFQLALDTPWAVGMVMTPTDALDDPHLAEREFLVPIETAAGVVQGIGTLWRGEGLDVAPLQVREAAADDPPARPDPGSTPRHDRPLTRLDGLRVLEMTVAWAGPYVGNLLAPLGIDVIKLEAQAPFDGWRALRPLRPRDAARPGGPGGRQPFLRGERAVQRPQPRETGVHPDPCVRRGSGGVPRHDRPVRRDRGQLLGPTSSRRSGSTGPRSNGPTPAS